MHSIVARFLRASCHMVTQALFLSYNKEKVFSILKGQSKLKKYWKKRQQKKIFVDLNYQNLIFYILSLGGLKSAAGMRV